MILQIDSELSNLIPPLSPDERQQLEESVLTEGCREALIVWDGVLVDGHNRLEICEAHGIPYQTRELSFTDREAAKEWILRNQLGRRNLNDYQRGVLALRLKESIAARAKEKQSSHTAQGYQKSDKAEHTLPQIAQIAGISHDSIHKVETIERDAPEPIKEAARGGVISINRAYETTKKLHAVSEHDRNQAAMDELNRQYQEKARQIDRQHKLKRAVDDAISNLAIAPTSQEALDAWLEDVREEDIRILNGLIESASANLKVYNDFLNKHQTIRLIRR